MRDLRDVVATVKGLNFLLFVLLAALGALLLAVLPTQAAAGVVGGTAALLIAFVAYPWQRGLDRRDALAKERRDLYLDLIDEVNDIDERFRRWDPGSEETYRDHLQDLLAACSLLDSKAMVAASESVSAAIVRFTNCGREDLRDLAHKIEELGEAATGQVVHVEQIRGAYIMVRAASRERRQEAVADLVAELSKEFGQELSYAELKEL